MSFQHSVLLPRLLQPDLPVLTEYDRGCLASLAAEGYEVDFLALSFVRT